jgi:mannonate dehydratase
MNRRKFLTRTAAFLATTAEAAPPFTFEDGLFNDCQRGLPETVTQSRAYRALAGDLDWSAVWDCHVHLLGNGQSGQGVWLNPDFARPRALANRARKLMFLSGACAGKDDAGTDARVVARLVQLAGELPPGMKLMLLAFDHTYDLAGKRRDDLTTFAVSNAYAEAVARRHPERFEWIASVHPYRDDVVEALEAARRAGARAVKWLPPAMGIDLAAARCRPAYDALRRLDLPLLTHVGEERAVEGAHQPQYGHPLLLRHPLEHGVRVVAAHAASLGSSPDTDLPGKAPATVSNFGLFSRLMAHRPYESLLYADISAVPQVNRGNLVGEIIRRDDWAGRLLNGSDYPLPGVLPLFSLNALSDGGLLDSAHVPLLRDVREANPLLFDLLLKRLLASDGQRFAPQVFETRRFFAGDRAQASIPPRGRTHSCAST